MTQKVAVFYPNTITSVWSLSKGLCTTLSRMGYEVLDATANPTPAPAALENQDIILVSGPEYQWERLLAKYPNWEQLKAKKYGWLHETVEREDYDHNPVAVNGTLPISSIQRLTPTLFTPAAQDEKYGFTYLPFGVDTQVFYPDTKNTDIIFVGSLYEKRRNFMERHPSLSTRNYKDFLQYKADIPFAGYANLTRRAMAVLNLPTLSILNSTRVYEALACRALVVTPDMGVDARNYSMFEHEKHLMYYTDNPEACFQHVLDVHTGMEQWHRTLSKLGERIAEAGYEEVKKNHTLEKRLETILQ